MSCVRISIITPSYNQARFLDETIRSVLAQRDQIHEYFILDGGSTDDSVKIIQRYASSPASPTVSTGTSTTQGLSGSGGGIDWWVSEKDKGQSDAIHRGFCRATGDVLYWLNSDDVLLPGALEKVRRAFEENPKWDVVTGYGLHIDGNSRIMRAFRMPGESRFLMEHGILHVCQQTCFFKRELYHRLGGLRMDLHCVMDTELWLRSLRADACWGHVPAYLGAFRIHEAAKGSSWLKKYAQEYEWLHENYPEHARRSTPWVGKILHYASQIGSGRHFLAQRDTRKWRNQTVESVFGAMIPQVPGSARAS